jgi:hypothetical protein
MYHVCSIILAYVFDKPKNSASRDGEVIMKLTLSRFVANLQSHCRQLFFSVHSLMVRARTRSIAKKSPQPSESPQRRRKRPSSSGTSLKVIEQLKEAGKETHLKATNTKKCYAGHVKRGREWLAEFFNGTTSPTDLPWLSPEQAPAVGQDGPDPYADPAFAHAFDSVPNEFSDKALSLFLTYKGFHQDLRRNTVEGIRAAFKDLWDRV